MIFSGISKSYGDKKVYENFSLTLDEGKVLCILGSSGSGKTTLLNIIAGLIPYEGEIEKLKTSYIFQEPRLLPNLTCLQNLLYVSKDKEKASEMLCSVGLADKKDMYPNTLSGGEARRVSLARAFVYDADIILLDEPFSSLDLKTKYDMMELFCSLQKKTKVTCLFVTHDIDEAVMLSHRIFILKDGKITKDIVLEGNPLRFYDALPKIKKELIGEILNG